MEALQLERTQRVIRRFYRAFQIPVGLCNGTELRYYCNASSFEPDPALCFLRTALETDDHEIQILHRHELLCGFVRISDTGYSILLGPVSTASFSDAQASGVLRELEQSLSRVYELRRSLRKAPVMDESHFNSLLQFFASLFNGQELLSKDVDQIELEDTRSPDTRMKMQDVAHNTQVLERDILSAITSGDSERLMNILPAVKGMDVGYGQTAREAVRDMRNVFITSAVLCSRAAIAGGMDYDHALTVSDNYIRQIEEIKAVGDIVPQIGMMMLDFCEQVARLQRPENSSPLTGRIVADAHAHLHEPLTVEAIAERLGFSVSYITHTFSKDMGQSLKSYIQQQKVDEARRLLENTDRSIAEIASLLGYSSQAHFQTSFRKITGTTPHAYRQHKGKE